MALLTPPVFMILWEGNIDGFVLLGLVALPLGVPLVMLKPTIAGWAVLARRQWFLWSVGFGLITLIVWRLWPLEMIGIFTTDYLHPMAMGWHNLGWPIAVIGIAMLLFTNADPIRLMAAGYISCAIYYALSLPCSFTSVRASFRLEEVVNVGLGMDALLGTSI